MATGGLTTILVLIPNVLFLLLPYKPKGSDSALSPGGVLRRATKTYQVMEWVERIGQITTFVIPFFYRLRIDESNRLIALLMLAMLLLYYGAWLRYFLNHMHPRMLYAPLAGIPLPMAFAPVIYFALASLLFESWPLLISDLVLAAGHLYISAQESPRYPV